MFEHADVVPVHKKKGKTIKQIIDRLVSSPICLKFMKNYCINDYTITSILFFHRNKVVFVKISAQHSLMVTLQKFKESIDRGGWIWALFTDFSKAFAGAHLTEGLAPCPFTKKNGENIYKILKAWLRNCRSIPDFMKKEIKDTKRERERPEGKYLESS